MPDAFTHIAIPTIFHKRIKKHFILPVFLIGTVVPDYARHIFSLFIPPVFDTARTEFHTILGAIFMSVLLSTIFNKKIRKRVFISLLAGHLIHFVFDMMQIFLVSKFYLLFPLKISFELGLFSESQWLYVFIFSFVVSAIYWMIYFIKKNPVFTPKRAKPE